MEKLYLFCVIFLTFVTISSTFNVDCSYTSERAYAILGYIYGCEVKNNLNIKSYENSTITSVSGTHMSGKTNDDVISFYAHTKVIEFFPKGLEIFFKSLKVICIYYGRLKQISYSDIWLLSNLMFLYLPNNDIEILEDGLFRNNQIMELVSFPSNKVFHVGKNVFNNMNNITIMDFSSNQCINLGSWDNATGVQIIIEAFKSKCFDVTFANFSQNLSNLEAESKSLTFETFPTWKENLENLEDEFKNSQFSYLLSIKRRFEVLNEIKIDDFTTQNPVTTSTTAITVTTTTAPPNDCNFEDLENNLSELFIKSLNQTENNLKNSFAESCTDVNYQTLYLMKDEFTKINEKLVEHSSEVRTEMIKNDVQHSSILNRITSLEDNLKILGDSIANVEDKLGRILDAVTANQN